MFTTIVFACCCLYIYNILYMYLYAQETGPKMGHRNGGNSHKKDVTQEDVKGLMILSDIDFGILMYADFPRNQMKNLRMLYEALQIHKNGYYSVSNFSAEDDREYNMMIIDQIKSDLLSSNYDFNPSF